MHEKRKPFATLHVSKPGAASIVAVGLAAVAFAIVVAAGFLQERLQKEGQLAGLRDSLSTAEARFSDLEQALHHSELDIRNLEAKLHEAETRLASNEVQLPMPLGFIDASEYGGPELYLISCVRIVIENAEASASYDRGVALTRYRAWDHVALRSLLDTSEYELVGKSSWSTDWEDRPDQEFYMLKDVMEGESFGWSRHKKRDSAYWDWWNYMERDCRKRN